MGMKVTAQRRRKKNRRVVLCVVVGCVRGSVGMAGLSAIDCPAVNHQPSTIVHSESATEKETSASTDRQHIHSHTAQHSTARTLADNKTERNILEQCARGSATAMGSPTDADNESQRESAGDWDANRYPSDVFSSR
ncbi:hypothetical protein LX32DRAFT_91485 [Colletotrichum zoysiae]|uniref:Uncharacterized protein n=1 Tax=Colletotrichum zoysiae TaxID=1216348 RepID=A0AAD9LXQ5_9PEZI|nr:hypothetical protein LX32DRAFT_91485 [Colletotrichum zoysiae]